MIQKWIGLLGIIALIFTAWILSNNKRKFPWRTVLSGVLLQFIFGILILNTTLGSKLFEFLQRGVSRLIGFADHGSRMVFGPLANTPVLERSFGSENTFIFFITVTATIVFVSSLSSFFYHYGVLQKVVKAMAWVMQRVMKTSGSESLAAAANIFMGQTEAPLVIKPYLAKMTQSEILALMVSGMATIATGVLAAYVSFGVSAGHLLTASVMSAPAGLLMAKVMFPETETSETAAGAHTKIPRQTRNGLDALCQGASEGMTLALNVMAMLIAFVAVVAFLNYVIAKPWYWFYPNPLEAKSHAISLQQVFGWVNAPFAFMMGVPFKDCKIIGQILGERIVLNEFIAYVTLTQNKANIDPRSFTIATYALCGFANFSSIAIQIGGIGSLVPSRKEDLAKLGFKAMIGGLLASYLTACIAGIFIN